MQLEDRINAFARLGDQLRALPAATIRAWSQEAIAQNPWFTFDSVQIAMEGITRWLNEEQLRHWTTAYRLPNYSEKTVGIATAGNIPLVGFHDFLCVLMAGHKLVAKVSSQDSILINKLTNLLVDLEPAFAERIQFADQLKDVDAVIATGSDNTARYFEYYFRNKPHIIRKNRSSCAVLLGEEPVDELSALGKDVFTYFGLGCRNVSKLYVPEGYSFQPLLDSWQIFGEVIHHHKYANNYDYQKSILLVNGTPFYETGYALLVENDALVSPVSLIYFEHYRDQADLQGKLLQQQDKIQCIVSAKAWYPKSVSFGMAQLPELWHYADSVDTLNFLQGL